MQIYKRYPQTATPSPMKFEVTAVLVDAYRIHWCDWHSPAMLGGKINFDVLVTWYES
ncbi:hypothetical protein SH668x_003602 [Planctomicrobium sp. SH668]|uniref:hypothetical protein n=1 Tax=Planctomicrobium sp. SH668 TaxID=3448126 RepID=UPI003F5B1127